MKDWWYVLTTAPRTEIDLAKLLSKDEALRDSLCVSEVYCPVETYSRWMPKKRHPVVRERPLAPRYLFLRCEEPYLALGGLMRHGAQGFVYQVCGYADDEQFEEPARVSQSAIDAVKVREAEVNARVFRRKDRSKRSIRQGSPVKVGDRLAIPHLGIDVPNQPVEKVEGNYAETVAPNGMRIRMPLIDIGAI
jgi:transcription antitermination factor NusG